MSFIPISKPSITKKEIAYVTDAVRSGWVSSLGKYIDMFEEKFAAYCGTKYAVATSNGTTALHLVLAALGITAGDEVIISDLTFVATGNAVKYTGAKVVTVDIEEETLCIKPEAIKKAITSKTKAIIPVHLYGHPANMEEINKIAKKHNLFVIEDAAEAHGAEVNGKKVGSLGHAGVFSFYGNKIITTGEGGMITTNDEELYKKMRYLRDHAMSKEKRYWHTEVGFNYRMTNLQAALGVAQLERIDELLAKKEEIFKWYQEGLKDVKGIRLNRQASWAKNVYWMVCLELDDYTEFQRDEFIQRLKSNNIDSRPYFYPLSDMPMYDDADTPIAHKVYKRGLNLPSYFDITKEEVDYICEKVKEIL
ncbi:DegT/DnrJ/EryC1/StrS family aminotransferase [Thermodesulfovibrio yellowstonii]|uniref:GDP-perosamine synthase n=1 Tax=Thermodesulfovibrio yellowstonii TaxID=28262 RepID=A0A9W6GHH6_9BACT|nr:DegT/DnrJ/EryC1/StrS family aminotransferase [Thermodesulfovibrio islandicus]GLI54148.1 aminotransferase DegT [Thermodesulfovibrio islandicus]